MRPNASCVDVAAAVGTPTASGIGNGGRAGTATLFSSPPVVAQTRPSGDVGSNRSHSVAGVRPTERRSASICSAVSRAEWFSGSPAMGRPQPLTV